MYIYVCIEINLYIYLVYFLLIVGNVPIQVYVGSKSTLAEGSSFGSTRGTENEVTDTMEVRTLQSSRQDNSYVLLYLR